MHRSLMATSIMLRDQIKTQRIIHIFTRLNGLYPQGGTWFLGASSISVRALQTLHQINTSMYSNVNQMQ